MRPDDYVLRKTAFWRISKFLDKKRGVSYSYRTAQLLTFATFPSWRSQKELVVQDLPRRKVNENSELSSNLWKKSLFEQKKTAQWTWTVFISL